MCDLAKRNEVTSNFIEKSPMGGLIVFYQGILSLKLQLDRPR